MKKKTTAKVNATKAVAKTPEVKPVEVKAVETATAKVEEVKAVAAEPVAEKKEVVAEKKEVVAEKKETKAAKTTKSTKTTNKAVKEEMKPEVYIQYQGQEAVVADAIEKAKAEFVADGHRLSSIKSLQIYLKPEEYAAFYVINQKFAGRVDLF